MTPKEKAIELIDKFQELNRSKISDYSRIEYPTAKQCALIAVDEVLRAAFYAKDDVYDYYMEVKLEIDEL